MNKKDIETYSNKKCFKLVNDKNKNVVLRRVELWNYIDQFIPKVGYKYFSTLEFDESRINTWKSNMLHLSKKECLNDYFEFTNNIIKDASAEALMNWENVSKEFEILCLTKNPLNKLMWGHYGDSFKGFCVAFNIQYPNSFIPIDYVTHRPNYSDEYNYLFNYKDEILKDDLDDELLLHGTASKFIVNIKDAEWSYEDEIRLIMTEGTENGNYDINKLKIEISSFIIGLKFDKVKHLQTLFDICDCINKIKYEQAIDKIMKICPIEIIDKEQFIRLKFSQKKYFRPIKIQELDYDDNLNLSLKEYNNYKFVYKLYEKIETEEK